MATTVVDKPQEWVEPLPASSEDWYLRGLAPLASLKLTVGLFALAIFLILASTLAQVEKDIWHVIDEYYRVWWAWIDFKLFIPPSFYRSLFDRPPPHIPGGFYFPGGATIGLLMVMNLLAAHVVRFQVQAQGERLIAGLLVLLAGIVLTTLVILKGHNPHGLQGEPWISYDTLWNIFLFCLGGVAAASVIGWWRLRQRQRLTARIMAACGAGLAVLTGYLLLRGSEGRLSDSAMRILWQLSQGAVAGLILLAGCWLVFKQRGGIVLLHAGIGLMMFGGFLVDQTAEEAQMHIREGETVNYVQDIRTFELAVIDPSDPEQDKVTVIPKALLLQAARTGEPISHPLLPFKVKVEQFYANADLRKPREGEQSPADQGLGVSWMIEPQRPGSGTDVDSKVDFPAAYITLYDRADHKLGTWLVSLLFSAQDLSQTVSVDGQQYQLALRFKRTYKPYRFQLIDVRKDDYLGTDTPRNYSSDVRLYDPSRQVDRQVRIWMNNPLRYAGETFYQSSYHRDPQTQQEATTLAVVTNTGWMIPYVSSMLVLIGMLAHFSGTLGRFLLRVHRASPASAVSPTESSSSKDRRREKRAVTVVDQFLSPQQGLAGHDQLPYWLGWGIPTAVTLVAVITVVAMAWPPRVADDAFDLGAFGRLPVISDGRAKPLDTLARSTMLVLSSRAYYRDHNEQVQPAIRWLLDLMVKPEQALQQPIFRIDNLDVQELLGLERREGFRYAASEFLPQLEKLTKQAELAHAKDPAEISVFDKKVLELERKLGLLDLLWKSFTVPRIENRDELLEAVMTQQSLARRHPPLAVPPTGQRQEWETFAGAWLRNYIKTQHLGQTPDRPTELWTQILLAYAENKPTEFRKQIEEYQRWLRDHPPPEVPLQVVEFEAFFNRFQPFTLSRGMYLAAFVLGMLSWLLMSRRWSLPLMRMGVGLALVAFTVHSFALVSRMYISGRPPVTNLYSSAVFIGWGVAGFGLLLHIFFRHGISTIVGTIAAFITLGIANHLSTDGDTFTVLQAVLDTQFWLATHVTCISLGYLTTYLAGLLGLIYVLAGLGTPWLNRDLARDLTRMTYGTLCFSLFFSFTGTVLGGLWADDSWGRFWGWDPKENGALMIVLWNALILHARWGGMIRERGLALLAIAGNIFVSWSWFGVNELGVGLHAYGFREGMVFWLCVTALLHLAVIALGLIPQKYWLSGLWTAPVRRPNVLSYVDEV
ncbi:MAG: cytochrome c biogenesis protein [Planctomycetaceae bacterium]|nr:MAG: cytochrome c biogenesis protein [Planctomycetaceae bacterium]